jgi:nucleotide-binding universal stress UspA family protein
MKNILLPTDFSENSWNAINYGIHFFENLECNFYLVHVSSLNTLVSGDEAYLPHANIMDTRGMKPIKQKLRDLLKRILKQDLNHTNQKFYTLTDYGFFIESIRKTVFEKQIDLTVMGTKGATGLKAVILGTNTADIITKVKCNTLVVPENAVFVIPKEIVFPTDFSLSHSLEILLPISDVLERFKSSLRILHVSETKVDLDSDQMKNKELLEDYFNHHHYFTFHYLTNKKVEDAIQNFIESHSINLICMVAKNLNYFQQIFFHSKVEAISYHTDIPFLVLHEKN